MVQVGPHDQYIVRVDGSRRLTTRNRSHLRQFESYKPVKKISSPVVVLFSREGHPDGAEHHTCPAGGEHPIVLDQTPPRLVDTPTWQPPDMSRSRATSPVEPRSPEMRGWSPDVRTSSPSQQTETTAPMSRRRRDLEPSPAPQVTGKKTKLMLQRQQPWNKPGNKE